MDEFNAAASAFEHLYRMRQQFRKFPLPLTAPLGIDSCTDVLVLHGDKASWLTSAEPFALAAFDARSIPASAVTV